VVDCLGCEDGSNEDLSFRNVQIFPNSGGIFSDYLVLKML
jgi:hypothetical protein